MEQPTLRYRNPAERRESILLALRTDGFLSIADLAQDLRVSHMTVRRDLQNLEQLGQVRMVYGGASLSKPGLRESGHWVGGDAADEARMGRCAASVVGDTDTIAIDAGRLCYEVARAISEDFRGTIVTHSLPVIQLLASRPRPPRVVGLGGEVNADSHAFLGANTVDAIDGVRIGTLFLSADALDARGAYAHSDAEVAVKRGLAGAASRIVVVAGHDSFDDAAPLFLGAWGRITALVTNRPPPEAVLPALRQAGVRVLVAGCPQ